ncbi:hypothetical protein [Luteitalea sp.]|uniref:hypothetical protein n=1 Tax=Luteitalea sp. TaxID=2004800 RepID=UPI0037C517E4
MTDTEQGRDLPARLQTLAERAARALLESDAVVAVRSPAWWRRLPRKVAVVLLVVLLALAGITWRLGGLTSTAASLLRKETRVNIPASDTIRLLAARVLARRTVPADTLAALARQAHLLEPDDPLRPHVLTAISRTTGVDIPDTLTPPEVLARVDAAAARATGRTLGPRGVIDWRPLDPYFAITLDELSGVSGVPRAVEVFNGMQPPDGLPSSEWYLDELVNAFDDPRPIPFVIVASSSRDDWGPVAMAPDDVPPHARRLPARTIGEALRIGLWGFDAYHPGDPAIDPRTWWQEVARQHGLPSFDP